MQTIQNQQQNDYLAILKLLTKGGFHTINTTTFNLSLLFDSNNWKAEGIIFTNCTFNSTLRFEHLSLQCGVRFENCLFAQGVYFEHCQASNSNFNFTKNGEVSIDFIGCTVNNGVNVYHSDLHYGIRASGSCIFERVHLLENKVGKVQFTGILVNNLFENSKVSTTSGYFFDQCTFNQGVSFYGCDTRILIENSKFTCMLFAGCKLGLLSIHSCEFLNEMHITGCNINLLGLYELVCNKSVEIDSFYDEEEKAGYLKEIKISDCEFKGELILSGQGKDDSAIGSLYITCSEKLKGNINVTNCGLTSMHLSGMNNSAITFSYARLQRIEIKQWVNKGMLSLISIGPEQKADSELQIIQSFIGRTILSDIDLCSYDHITIAHSNVYEVLSNSVTWFSDKQLKPEPGSTSLAAIKIKRDLYRQLKFAMEKQGDHFNRLRFRKEEQTAYRTELKLTPFKNRSVGDQLIMAFGWTNDYGFNWLRPLLLIFCWVSISFFILAFCAAPGTSGPSVGYLMHYAYQVFNLLNPAHRVDELFGIGMSNEPSIWFYSWDFLERLFLSLLLFQLVTAFRKYSL